MSAEKQTLISNIEDNFNEAIHAATHIYFEGGVFVYPTDTIYGFGANPFNKDALAKITFVKRRSIEKKYILLAADISMVLKHVDLQHESHADFLISLWPNPISIVLKLNGYFRDIMESETMAFRIPNHKFCRKLLNDINMPLVSTSVNRSDEPEMNDFTQISQEFSHEIDAIFYSEKPPLNIASTVIDLTGQVPTLLREGMISFQEVMAKYDEKCHG
ncbi:MAG: threonylcarbamoyl-AMP synthase [Ignavibacteriales bacterium]|nr:threonylcarbamoyl-AMP synthase [Ignavibacteriales bacterium]